MRSLHYPTPGSPSEVPASLFSLASLLLIGRANVGLVASRLQLLAHRIRVVGRVQAQVLLLLLLLLLLLRVWLLSFGSGACYHQPVQGRNQQFRVVAVGPLDGHR